MSRQKEKKVPIIISTEELDGESIEMIPFLDDENASEKETFPNILPILPVRNTVLFPGVIIPITVGRQKSIKLIKKAYKGDKIIGVLAQANESEEEPSISDLFVYGTVAKILKILVLPDGNTTIIIQGKVRFRVNEVESNEPYLKAKVEILKENFPKQLSKELKALVQSLKDTAFKILKLNPEIPREAQMALSNIESPMFLTHFLSSNVNVEVKDKQKLLDENEGVKRAELLLNYLLKDVQMLELKMEIQNKANSDINQQQRDYFLKQQIKVLQDELGFESAEQEIENLRTKGEKKNWNETIKNIFNKELDKVLRINPSASEYPMALNYVEYLCDLPWEEFTKDNFDLKRASKVLDSEHFGLEKVKERIIEYLAVLKLKNNMKAPILCLYGPPGVGKTSLGKSIAKALGRKYVRMSLGGLHDEAEIRGHRRTYIGAMPGKIIQNLKKAQSSNPVFILDEIDKMGVGHRSDPSSAMLEVLDLEQNSAFRDNYLDIDYDLSKILFIATANSLENIQPALRDRMEIIEISGYTLEEKTQIAKKYLVPKQREEHGIGLNDMNFEDKAIISIIDKYTRESGVRNLERQIGGVARKLAKIKASDEILPKKINTDLVVKYLGTPIFEKDQYEEVNQAGIVTGLAWTSVGGEILTIETSISRGKGKLILSGQLGDVMKESAGAALTYLKTQADALNINYKLFDNSDIHIHVPAGAVPKDGPSAGITIFTALTSAFTQRKVNANWAMTGEITLSGKVLPVGGIKEKILAAKRAGITNLVLCEKNRKDIEEIAPEYLKGLNVNYAINASEVLNYALSNHLVNKPLILNNFIPIEIDKK